MWRRLCLFISLWLMKNAVLQGTPVSEPCHSNYRNVYPYTGIETPYSYIYDNSTAGSMTLTNCKPMQIWMLTRHGTEYPSETMMKTIVGIAERSRPHFQNIVKKVYGRMTNNCIPLYAKVPKNWDTCPAFGRKRKEKYLTRQGEKDMLALGQRIRAKLPTLFFENVTKSFKVEFRSTAAQSTTASMLTFAKGAFDVDLRLIPNNNNSKFESMNVEQEIITKLFEGAEGNVLNFRVVPVVNDTLLKLYDTCESWYSVFNEQVAKFVNGPEMAKVVDDVSRYLSLPDPIKQESVAQLYDVCRFERAVCPEKPSPWCDVFTNDQMRTYEYQDDLFSYYDVGPGEKINGKLGCHLVRDMFEHFTKLEIYDDEPSGVFYFADFQMISLFLTAMGIGRDSVPPTAANFRDTSYRSWKVSQLVPSAANFAAVFHRCNSRNTPFKVSFYLNESPVTLEGCEDGICNWAQLKKKLGIIAANCNEKICEKNFGQNTESSSARWLNTTTVRVKIPPKSEREFVLLPRLPKNYTINFEKAEEENPL